MDERRSLRVSEAVREELAEIIRFEMSDPRLSAVDVTGVSLSPDGRHADVRVGIEGDESAERAALTALDHARSYLRHQLSARLQLRRIPDLHFSRDKATDAEMRVDLLLRRARKSRGKDDRAE